jgi:hypothetical protein
VDDQESVFKAEARAIYDNFIWVLVLQLHH